jgi:hypothetical protein
VKLSNSDRPTGSDEPKGQVLCMCSNDVIIIMVPNEEVTLVSIQQLIIKKK